MSSPKIVSISWGSIRLSGDLPEGKDYKLYPGGGRIWDWNETATRHSPGIQIADVQELVEHGAEEIVLTRGMQCKLGIEGQTVKWLEGRGIKVHVDETLAAVQVYNSLVEKGVKAGGCFHSTC